MKDLFEKLLSELRQKNVITEEDGKTFLADFDKRLDGIKESAFKTAERVLDEDHAQKLEQVVESLDEKHGVMLEEILEKVDADHTGKLEQVVEIIDEKHGAMLEQILEKIDQEHASKLEQVVEHLDEKHASMLEQVLAKIDEDHTAKMEAIFEAMENHKDDGMVDKLSAYLKTYLEEVTPTAKLADNAKIDRLEKMFESMKQLLFVNDDYVQTEIKEALEDAKSQIDEANKKVDALMFEKVALSEKLEDKKAKAVLEAKLAKSPVKIRAHCEATFKGASAAEIEEKFQTVVEAFEADEKERREQIVEESKDAGVKQAVVIADVAPAATLQKSIDESFDPAVASYVNTINRSYKNK